MTPPTPTLRDEEMLLTKSCHAKDNTARRKTLKLATLEHYRRTEIEQIADENEGRLFFEIDIRSPIKVEKRWFNTLFEGLMRVGGERYEAVRFPGGFHAQVRNWNVDDRHPAYAIIERADISITRQTVESLVFCMSQTNKPGDMKGVFPKYDDEWSIDKSNVELFLDALGEALGNRLLDTSKQSIISPDIDPKEVEIHVDHMPVFYADRNITVTRDRRFDIDALMKHMAHTAFIKPTSYEREREYRFNFVLVHKGKPLDLLLDEVIIDATDELLGFII
ncbi:hypothetical protein [Pseudomonas sp. AFG_SD02_1510_Pfu_092]|uniref:hypothetical protein n=1 Tax=Pseudomonas sp. AFG_SD02_1510_Pfu_092 TaxID=2259497 RepID=UPI001058E4CD|nr:hypothetical protein [Pseudomonas sp. AFG_SD02_1510_Pfu_092]